MLKQTTTDKYVTAFTSVPQMLEPNAKFDNVIVDTQIGSEGNVIHKNVVVSGKTDSFMVVVTTVENPMKGLQIVLTYIDNVSLKVLKERSYWYFSFNWKGLSETASLLKDSTEV